MIKTLSQGAFWGYSQVEVRGLRKPLKTLKPSHGGLVDKNLSCGFLCFHFLNVRL